MKADKNMICEADSNVSIITYEKLHMKIADIFWGPITDKIIKGIKYDCCF